MSVSVGLGTGNKDQMLQHLQMVLMNQEKAAALGLATPKNIYNALVKLTQNAGFKMPDEFWTDPEKAAPQQPQPNPEMIKAQATQQAAQTKAQADMQMQQEKSQSDAQIRHIELMAESSEREKDRQNELEKVRIQGAIQIELARITQEDALHARMMTAQQPVDMQSQVAPQMEREMWDAERVVEMVNVLRQDPPTIHVNVPEAAVNVHPPAVNPPAVHVNMPAQKRMRRVAVRDEQGNIQSIDEQPMDDGTGGLLS
jgi:hypothetical protein